MKRGAARAAGGGRTLVGTGMAHTVTVQEGFAIHQLNDLHELAKCLQANFTKMAADDEEQYLDEAEVQTQQKRASMRGSKKSIKLTRTPTAARRSPSTSSTAS